MGTPAGKTALFTGAGRGTGRRIARELAHEMALFAVTTAGTNKPRGTPLS
ncbi:hypothetical protein [Streptomyces sp. NPDC050287]